MRLAIAVSVCSYGVIHAQGKPAAAELALDWRRVGNSQIWHNDRDVATGEVRRVWFTGDGIGVQTANGQRYESRDGETWRESAEEAPARGGAAAGPDLFGPVLDVAVSSADADDLVVATRSGVWRSRDGGRSWASWNEGLPNLSIRRLLSAPAGGAGLRAATADSTLEWMPGQKRAWSRVGEAPAAGVVEVRGEMSYSVDGEGRIVVARNGQMRSVTAAAAPVVRFWVDAADPMVALAAAGTRLLRTNDGGLLWEDVTGALRGEIRGVTASRASSAVYVATTEGVFLAALNFAGTSAVPVWTGLAAPSRGAISDVLLDSAANQLYVAVDGWGVYATLAPHRRWDPAVVSAADLVRRAAAPGALLSVLGPALTGARTGTWTVPILSTADGESQLQVPYEVAGGQLSLRLESSGGGWDVSLPLEAAAPAIFTDRDGAPLLLDGESGVLLDAMHPARSGTRLQLLAAGLGRVQPEWPAGLEAPFENPPRVVAPVRVLLDGQPLTVTRATLAPGYVGFYLVEAEVPALVNSGTATVTLEASGRLSNAVRVYIEP